MGVAGLFLLLLLPVLVAYASGPSECCSMNVTVVAGESNSFPGGVVTGDYGNRVEYRTSVVESEYIVVFVSYYTTQARDGFLAAALHALPPSLWTIIPRPNPVQDYPSDFSLVRFNQPHEVRGITESDGVGVALSSLSRHPAIKRVTPQKKLTKILATCETWGWGCGLWV